MNCILKSALFGAATLASIAFSGSAGAVTLFNNISTTGNDATGWCSPCVNSGFRVWDSFTLANDSTLTSLRWLGRVGDPLTLGVVVEIAYQPYGTNIFTGIYDSASITRVVTPSGFNTQRTVSLPNIDLDAGTYWLSIHGPSLLEQHSWLGEVLVSQNDGDNSLIQYFGLDPNNPTSAFFRNQDAIFRIDGDINTPLPAALPLFATVLGIGGLIARRRKQKLAA